ncbi:hypothetical protein D9M68_623500 [compost metagenome]
MAIVGLLQPWVLGGDRLEAPGQGAPGLVGGIRHIVPGALVVPAEGLAVGHRAFDGAAQAVEIVRQVAGAQGGEGGDHAATDIHAHGGGNDGAHGRDHAADGRALAQVHVGHHRQVLVDEGHLRRVDQLLAGFVFHRHALGPQADGLAAGHLKHLRAVRFHLDCLMNMWITILGLFAQAGCASYRRSSCGRRSASEAVPVNSGTTSAPASLRSPARRAG